MKRYLLFAILIYSNVAHAGTDTPRALLVVMEGFSSCKQGDDIPEGELHGVTRHQLADLIQRVKTENGVEPKLVFSCFGLNVPKPLGFLSDIDLRFASDYDPTTYQRTEFSAEFEDEIKSARARNTYPEAVLRLFDFVKQYRTEHPELPIYLIGHSYGGWLAMQAVLSGVVKPRVMVTIDPISPLYCSTERFLDAGIATFDGCRTAPPDVSKDQVLQIARGTHWLNLYQTQFHRLHSSAIEGATQNVRVQMPNTNPIFNIQHVSIAQDAYLWNVLAKSLTGR